MKASQAGQRTDVCLRQIVSPVAIRLQLTAISSSIVVQVNPTAFPSQHGIWRCSFLDCSLLLARLESRMIWAEIVWFVLGFATEIHLEGNGKGWGWGWAPPMMWFPKGFGKGKGWGRRRGPRLLDSLGSKTMKPSIVVSMNENHQLPWPLECFVLADLLAALFSRIDPEMKCLGSRGRATLGA